MRFVPVGQTLLFSVWTTRVMDYARFCQATGRTAPPVDFVQGPAHPAVNVSRDDAEAFCAWLTARELAAGGLRVGQGLPAADRHRMVSLRRPPRRGRRHA